MKEDLIQHHILNAKHGTWHLESTEIIFAE